MKDKFLVTAITLEDESDENLSQSKLAELLKVLINFKFWQIPKTVHYYSILCFALVHMFSFQNNRPEAQYRLRCSLSSIHLKASSSRLQIGGAKEISPTSSTLASANKQLENLSKKVRKRNVLKGTK